MNKNQPTIKTIVAPSGLEPETQEPKSCVLTNYTIGQ